MMTTNKNQRTTHIDDVVKYQPTQAAHFFFQFSFSLFLCAFCAICDFFYNYLCMHFKFADENDEITHTNTPLCAHTSTFVGSISHSRALFLSPGLTLGFIFEFLSSTIFTSFAAQYIYNNIFFATLYFILLFVCAKLCVAPIGEKKKCMKMKRELAQATHSDPHAYESME